MMLSLFSSDRLVFQYFLHLYLCLAYLPPLAIANATRLLPNTSIITPRFLNELRIKNCDAAQTSAIQVALGEIPNIAQAAVDRIASLEVGLMIQDDDVPEFAFFDNVQQSTYDMFETMFGMKIYDSGKNPLAINALKRFYGAYETLATATSAGNIGGQSLDIWCGGSWETTTDTDGSPYLDEDGTVDPDARWDNSGNNIGWLVSDASEPDDSEPDDTVPLENCDNPLVDAYTVSKKTPPYVSIITLCAAFKSNGLKLTDQAKTAYTAGQQVLDNIVSPSLTALLIHELSHAFSIMNGLQYATADLTYSEGYGYGWKGVRGLAVEKPADSPRNADSFAYFAVALYFPLNTWWNGMSLPITQSAPRTDGIDWAT